MARVPQTYMSAAGVQSEIAYKTLARVACHEAACRKQVRRYRQNLENHVRVLEREEILAKKTMRKYVATMRRNHKKPIVKRTLSGRLVYGSASPMRRTGPPGNDDSDVNNGETKPPLSEKLSLSPNPKVKTASGDFDSKPKVYNSSNDASILNLEGQPHFSHTDPVVDSTDCGIDAQDDPEYLEESNEDNGKYSADTEHDATLSTPAIEDNKTEVSQESTSVANFDQNKSDIGGTPKLPDIMDVEDWISKSPKRKPKVKKKQAISTLELFRLAQRSNLSKNLHIVDRIIKRKIITSPNLESVQEHSETTGSRTPVEGPDFPVEPEQRQSVVSLRDDCLEPPNSETENDQVSPLPSSGIITTTKPRRRRVGRQEDQGWVLSGLSSPQRKSSIDEPVGSNVAPAAEFVQKATLAADNLLSVLDADSTTRARSNSLSGLRDTKRRISSGSVKTKERSISLDHTVLQSRLPPLIRITDGTAEFSEGQAGADKRDETQFDNRRLSRSELELTRPRKMSDTGLRKMLSERPKPDDNSKLGMGNRWMKALQQVRVCHYLEDKDM